MLRRFGGRSIFEYRVNDLRFNLKTASKYCIYPESRGKGQNGKKAGRDGPELSPPRHHIFVI